MPKSIGVGIVGYAFMGQAHSQAWRTVAHAFDVPLVPRLVALSGRDRQRGAAAATKLGWESFENDWRSLVAEDDVEIVDICAPGDTHAPIALAALAAGKHVLCEKPLANTLAEAREMAVAARRAAHRGVRAMVGFNYRRVPALALARQLVSKGQLGEIRHLRAVYLQDWLVDPASPLTWRLDAAKAGSGALGDLGAHIVDLAQWILGDRIASVTAMTETFVRERPLQDQPGRHGPVTVDDAALFLARFALGTVATFEATRFSAGRKNVLRIEIDGALGSLAFDLERLNELSYADGRAPGSLSGFRRVLVTEADHPYMQAWYPTGHVLGWEHTFTHEVFDFLSAIADGTEPQPSFADGYDVQCVLDAVARSAASGTWIQPSTFSLDTRMETV